MHSRNEDLHAEVPIESILRQHWRPEDYADERESQSYFATGVVALRKYLMTIGYNAGRTMGTEVFLSRVVRLGDMHIRLGCKVDRLVLRPNGELVALDYKTSISGKVPTEESLAADLGNYLYYVLVRLCYPEYQNVVVAQLNIRTLAIAEARYDEERRRARKEELVELTKEISMSNFKPSPSAACAWCPVKDYCSVFGSVADIDAV
jgi:RecB family exonuclease